MSPTTFSAQNVSAQIAHATITIDDEVAGLVKADPFMKELIDLIAKQPEDASHFAVYVGEKILWELLVPEEIFPEAAPIPSIPYRALALSYLQASFNARRPVLDVKPGGQFMEVERKLAGLFEMKYLISVKPKDASHVKEIRNEVLHLSRNLSGVNGSSKAENSVTASVGSVGGTGKAHVVGTGDRVPFIDPTAEAPSNNGINVHAPSFEVKVPARVEQSIEAKQPTEVNHAVPAEAPMAVSQPAQVQKSFQQENPLQQSQAHSYTKNNAEAAADAFQAMLMGQTSKKSVPVKATAVSVTQIPAKPDFVVAQSHPEASSIEVQNTFKNNVISAVMKDAIFLEAKLASKTQAENTKKAEPTAESKATLVVPTKPTAALASPITFSAAPTAPLVLPTGWRYKLTPNGRPYYIDDNTHTTSWSPPTISTRASPQGTTTPANQSVQTTPSNPAKSPSPTSLNGSGRTRLTKLDEEGLAATKRFITRGLGAKKENTAPIPAPAPASASATTGNGAWGSWVIANKQ